MKAPKFDVVRTFLDMEAIERVPISAMTAPQVTTSDSVRRTCPRSKLVHITSDRLFIVEFRFRVKFPII